MTLGRGYVCAAHEVVIFELSKVCAYADQIWQVVVYNGCLPGFSPPREAQPEHVAEAFLLARAGHNAGNFEPFQQVVRNTKIAYKTPF